jgi:L-threonylcarbamoyladenylate synthase
MPDFENEKLAECLSSGGVAVMPTDTIYGILGKAENKETVESIYKLKGRNPDKPSIILVANLDDLKKFSIHLSPVQEEKVKDFWFSSTHSEKARPTSIIFDCEDPDLEYLHRGMKSLAFRLPQIKEFRNLIAKTGPLIAPSANPEGFPPAEDTEQAEKYFGKGVDFYLDGGQVSGEPSRIIKLERDGSVDILRN